LEPRGQPQAGTLAKPHRGPADGDKRERYRYDYSPPELCQWAANARELARRAEQVHVIVNACRAGAAQSTAADLRTALGELGEYPAASGALG
jgi:uncharacterized protein YecE (DUF72 family)